jgi:atypical dual specificity phosphatase
MSWRGLACGLMLLSGCSTEPVAATTGNATEFPVFHPGQTHVMNGFSWVIEASLAGAPQPGAYNSIHLDLGYMQEQGVDLLISGNEEGVDADVARHYDIDVVSLPVEDFQAPTMEQMNDFVAHTRTALAGGDQVAVHCTAGMGRTGTYLAVWFVTTGMTADEAMEHVRSLRPGSIETPIQEAAILEFCVATGTCESG